MIDKTANDIAFDKVVHRSAMVRIYEDTLSRDVFKMLTAKEKEVARVITDSKLDTAGKKKMILALSAVNSKAFSDISKEFNTRSIDFARDQMSHTHNTIDSAIGKLWRTKPARRQVAENIVLKRKLYDDATLEAGWSKIRKADRKRIESLVRRGVAQGLSPDKIAKAVSSASAQKITKNHSRTLVATGTTSIYAQADMAVMEANKNALDGYQYVSILDTATTDECIYKDGRVYKVGDYASLPPSHYGCRAVVTPVFKKWETLGEVDSLSQLRKRNLASLTTKQKAYYDGKLPLRQSYAEWLRVQDPDIQLKHLGDYHKVELLRAGKISVDKFITPDGATVGVRQLRKLTDSNYTAPGDTNKFAFAKKKLDAMRLGAASPEDLFNDAELTRTLRDYYLLQAGELDGTLSLTNFRGVTLATKRAAKKRVLQKPPTEAQLRYNPITGTYDDARRYYPNPEVFATNLRLLDDSVDLLDADKAFIKKMMAGLELRMSSNERAVVLDNLRIIFTRYRKDGKPWANFKAVIQGQIKFDIMNVSDTIETATRRGGGVIKKLKVDNYIDPVLGQVQLQDLHDKFFDNIRAKNRWEDKTAPAIARSLRDVFDYKIPLEIKTRLKDDDLQAFYLRFANRLSLADSPDFDQLAISLGRDLYNSANYNGARNEWFKLGKDLLETSEAEKLYKLETFGVQKRRMKSRLGVGYFGPYYDSFSYNIRLTDPRIQAYSRLSRKVDVGLRVAVTDDKNKLVFREGYKTYFMRTSTGLEDTRIPITSTNAFGSFPEAAIDKTLVDALNWASSAKYKIDDDFFSFTQALINFEDDKGNAKKYNNLNEYKHYIASRGDAYERFKSMEWLQRGNKTFSNHAFVDSRLRIYDRGLISPQSGESFRPFFNTARVQKFSVDGYRNYNDQVGAFLGGLDDYFEDGRSSLTITGRQGVAEYWRAEMVRLGNLMLSKKPRDIREILESDMMARIEGEELGKFMRFAMEAAKMDKYLDSDYSDSSLERLADYDITLALEQDASSSGAQIIALTTKNKQLAQLSNVVPTSQKRRLYDEIAASTFHDPRFKEMNLRLGLTEKDLRKAAKAQNMVSFYGAGERTGILAVEGKLGKILGRNEGTLVVKASDRDVVLDEISANMARYRTLDAEVYRELKVLRANVKDIFNKGLSVDKQIMDQLYFLDSGTKDLVMKMTGTYENVITPNDFRQIASIMSENLASQVPILQDFTKFFSGLAEKFLLSAKPSQSAMDYKSLGKYLFFGEKKGGRKLPSTLAQFFGVSNTKSITETVLQRFDGWKPDGFLSNLVYGFSLPTKRRTGFKKALLDYKLGKSGEIEIFKANKMPKKWTNVPWVNFDGKVLEQNFTQVFEEKLVYKNAEGNFITNIVQVPQKTETTWWEALLNKDGNINDIADLGAARTAFAVNGNHSNDAVIVKKFHLWGKKNNVHTSTIHDAFFANASEMTTARQALKEVYAELLDNSVVKDVLDEMLARGLPKVTYDAELKRAIEIGLIPVPGVSVVGGKLLEISDILTKEDILKATSTDFTDDNSWYGIG